MTKGNLRPALEHEIRDQMIRPHVVRVLGQVRHRISLLNHLKLMIGHGLEEILRLPRSLVGENAHAALLQHSTPLREHSLVGLVQVRQSPDARHGLEGRVLRGVQRLAQITLDRTSVHWLVIHQLLAGQLERLAADVEAHELTGKPNIAHLGAGHACSTPKIRDGPVQGDVLGQHLSSHLRRLVTPGDQGVVVGCRPIVIELCGAFGVLRGCCQGFPGVEGSHGCGQKLGGAGA
mmetsp:Transcript_4711/g.11472  ORF Transcript_4711/g.11472 Transcript_4711/m.11472 type:complete len:234 (-) Transcript_4711:2-703(-)